jgi:hypothetical protein
MDFGLNLVIENVRGPRNIGAFSKFPFACHVGLFVGLVEEKEDEIIL